MAIERYSDYYTIVMETLKEEGPMHRKDLRSRIADMVGLSDEERGRTNEKGTNIFNSRIHWAGAVLVLGGLLERPTLGQIAITVNRPGFGTDAGLGDSFSHAATAAGVAIMVSNSIGVKRPSAA
jgi:restriction endonuclease Mrr